MTREEAIELWERLVDRWPTLGGAPGDLDAAERAKSFGRLLRGVDPGIGRAAVDELIRGHRGDRPQLADLQDVARRVARRQIEEASRDRRAREQAEFVPVPEDTLAKTLAEMRAACARGKHSLGVPA